MASAETAIDLTQAEVPDDNPDPIWEPTPSTRYGKDEIITLLVGPEETEMLALASCLSFHSEFFRTALKKEWAEGQTRTVKLPEEEPGIIAQYLDFLVGRGLPTDSTRMDSQKGEVYVALTALYALGERLLDSTLRNKIITEIIRFTTVLSPNGLYNYIYPGDRDIIDYVYNYTTPASPARRLMVDLYIYAGNTTWVVESLHPAFLRDLAEALMLQVQNTDLPCRIFPKAAAEYFV
jgi:hypothetical protein